MPRWLWLLLRPDLRRRRQYAGLSIDGVKASWTITGGDDTFVHVAVKRPDGGTLRYRVRRDTLR